MLFQPVARSLAVAALGTTLLAGASGEGRAQVKLDARYTASLSGVPIGKGAWVIDVAEDQYTAAASGTASGLMRLFASGRGTGAARGAIAGGQLVPASYAASIMTDKKYDEVRMTLASGSVKEFVVDPPQAPNPERVPVPGAHRRGVQDPMTASLLRVPGHGDPLVPESCQRKISVFDGRMRYDLQLEFKRLDRVQAEKGYQGPAVVCAVYFSPLSGHIPNRAVIKYLIETRDIEVWLVPLASTRVLVPFRVSIPTPFGTGVVQATQFVLLPQPARPTAANAKTQ